MKVLIIITLVTSIACVVMSTIQNDLTEALAWFCIALYNTKDLINNLLNDK
jgi:hypothetical protein